MSWRRRQSAVRGTAGRRVRHGAAREPALLSGDLALAERVDRCGRIERDIGSTLIASQATRWFKRRRVLEVIMKAKYPRSRSSRLALVPHPPGRGSKSR